jgi:hypothetical protein
MSNNYDDEILRRARIGQVTSTPEQPGSNILERGLAAAKGAIQEFTGEARGFMKRVRSAGLPTNGNPTQQTTTTAKFNAPGEVDWRVKLSLPSDKNFTDSPLLEPLVTTNGLVFPYTPTMIISHSANYSPIHPVHTNYPFYAYENSQVDQLVIAGSFVVQNSLEAQYWVACLHYLRSATKMYYGQSEPQGMPPPVVKLSGYGDYVFNNVPVVITNFTVDMPQDVDYIATEIGASSSTRTQDLDSRPQFTNIQAASAISFAPSESTITVTCQPIYSRSQTEKFSLNSFVKGDYVSNGSGYI